MTRLFVGAGRAAGIRPQDLVGAITGESEPAAAATSARSRSPTASRWSRCRKGPSTRSSTRCAAPRSRDGGRLCVGSASSPDPFRCFAFDASGRFGGRVRVRSRGAALFRSTECRDRAGSLRSGTTDHEPRRGLTCTDQTDRRIPVAAGSAYSPLIGPSKRSPSIQWTTSDASTLHQAPEVRAPMATPDRRGIKLELGRCGPPDARRRQKPPRARRTAEPATRCTSVAATCRTEVPVLLKRIEMVMWSAPSTPTRSPPSPVGGSEAPTGPPPRNVGETTPIAPPIAKPAVVASRTASTRRDRIPCRVSLVAASCGCSVTQRSEVRLRCV